MECGVCLPFIELKAAHEDVVRMGAAEVATAIDANTKFVKPVFVCVLLA